MALPSAVLSLGRKTLHAWRHSFLANAILRALAPSIAKHPIEDCPAWKAKLCGLKVPRRVTPRDDAAPLGAANINIILSLLEEAVQADGDLCECGVFRGSTLVPTGLFLKQRGLDRNVFGCDSFEGFGEAISIDIELGGMGHEAKRVHGMNTTSMRYVAERVNAFGLDETVTLVPGYFENTLQQLADRTFCYVHLDCDMYDSYRTCMEFFYPRMAPGGIILFDEYDDPYWPGCNKAIDEYLSDKPERPVRIERDNFVKSFVRKEQVEAAAAPSAPDLARAG
ncbi:MAG: TylF/MycF/NovP-related O-methyltransferase [Planctomycetota bacterium]|jgi:hypothetical protein